LLCTCSEFSPYCLQPVMFYACRCCGGDRAGSVTRMRQPTTWPMCWCATTARKRMLAVMAVVRRGRGQGLGGGVCRLVRSAGRSAIPAGTPARIAMSAMSATARGVGGASAAVAADLLPYWPPPGRQRARERKQVTRCRQPTGKRWRIGANRPPLPAICCCY
jgi:hypothetical protein